jgi:hypothetical protein
VRVRKCFKQFLSNKLWVRERVERLAVSATGISKQGEEDMTMYNFKKK